METSTLENKPQPELAAFCMSFPGAWEDHPWGETVFKIGKKIFAFVGPTTICVKSTLDHQAALIQHPDIAIAPYVGRYGWVTLGQVDSANLDLAKDLIEASYRLVHPRKRNQQANP